MSYLPTFRLFFQAGVYNDYRLRDGLVEFSSNEGEWRSLDDSDVELHFRFKTPVSKWLQAHYVRPQQPGRNQSARKTQQRHMRVSSAKE